MPLRVPRNTEVEHKAWLLDQLAKSEFFHEKLHEWRLLEIINELETIPGEDLSWDLDQLNISAVAWNKIIHRGIKPIIVFAHPTVLQTVDRTVGYYRMLSMVSQKSMSRVGLPISRESGEVKPEFDHALAIANHLNQIVSSLIEADKVVNVREFDLWRGMAAGTQAQGSWQNLKGSRIEAQVRAIIRQRIRETGGVVAESVRGIELQNGRFLVFGDEPDVAIYDQDVIQVAMEIKGGIDTAAILERIGAAIKSLSRAKEENAEAHTILLVQEVSLTKTATSDLEINRLAVNHWFTIESFLGDTRQREAIFQLMGL